MTPRERADGIVNSLRSGDTWTEELSVTIEHAITAAVEQEREECAKIANAKADRVQSQNDFGWGMRSIADSIATAIRERGEPTASASTAQED